MKNLPGGASNNEHERYMLQHEYNYLSNIKKAREQKNTGKIQANLTR
jgi:hypothetical protein